MPFKFNATRRHLWVPKISSGAGADASMGYPDGGMTNLLKLLGGFFVGLFRSRAAVVLPKMMGQLVSYDKGVEKT